jgi:hypothetical protein
LESTSENAVLDAEVIQSNASPEPHLNQLTIENNNPPARDYRLEIALTGATLINLAESKNSLKYLFTHYVPIMPYINQISDYLGISQYEHYINTGIFMTGGGIIAYSSSTGDYGKVLYSSGLYFFKPSVYQGLDNVLSYIYNQESSSYLEEVAKFTIYVATDAALSLLVASPLVLINPASFYYNMVYGASMGAIRYYNQASHKENKAADNFASAVTTLALTKLISEDRSLVEKIIYSGASLNYLANLHYVTKNSVSIACEYIFGNNDDLVQLGGEVAPNDV